MARFWKVVGTISKIKPNRTFVDGVYCTRIEFTGTAGVVHAVERAFFTLKLESLMSARKSGEFYFWNSHCYAFRSGGNLIEDMDGARTSYFKRDSRLLIVMAVSLILLPVAIFVMAKKLLRAGTRHQMEMFLSS